MYLQKLFPHLKPDLLTQIESVSEIVDVPAGVEVLKEGQSVAAIPIVLEGLLKVYTRYEDRELLLYYIQPKESCVMSFSTALMANPSKVFAVTEEPTKALMIPSAQISNLVRDYPDINTLFFNFFNARYVDLLETIQHILFNKMDERVLMYLQKKVRMTGQSIVKLTHQHIANEVGTAREVISRVLKKLETEGSISQTSEGIKILGM